MIELRGVKYSYSTDPKAAEGVKVLEELDLDFIEGERVGILGPNGCGKTTLFHIIMGLLAPQSGEVKIFGKPRVEEADFREVRARIGLLFQDANDQLFCPTVAEDVAFGPLNLGKSTHEAMEIVHKTLKMVGLEGFEDRITYKLSGGEKRLVSLATVMAMNPEALLLDEPVAGLDEETTGRIVEILNNSDLSYIVISHDRDFLIKTTKKLMTIKNGKIEPISSMDQI